MIVKRQKIFFGIGIAGINDEDDERFKPYVTEEWKKKTDDEKLKEYCKPYAPRMLYYKDHPEEYKKEIYLRDHKCANEITRYNSTLASSPFTDLYYSWKYDHEHKKKHSK
jgi:hypothetical protein